MATALEQSIRDICAANNVSAFSLSFLLPNDEHGVGWSVSLQRWNDGSPRECAYGDADSITEALTQAVAKLRPLAVTIADEPLTVEAA